MARRDRVRRTFAPRVSEKTEQAHGVCLLKTLGADVFVSGTVRRRGDHPGTMQTPGIPDVEVWLPLARSARDRAIGILPRRLLKWEVKAVDGRLRPEQIAYQQLCIDAGIDYVVGPCNTLIEWLMAHAYLSPDRVPHYRVPEIPQAARPAAESERS